MKEAELRDESFEVSQKIAAYCQQRGVVATQFALAWCIANPILTAAILGPRTMRLGVRFLW